jgi:lipopolysaccharide biosynthesis glycosyltransferase
MLRVCPCLFFTYFSHIDSLSATTIVRREIFDHHHPSTLVERNDMIEVVTACDDKFVDILPTMLTSLHRHHYEGEVRVTILTEGLSDESQKSLKTSIATCCSNLEIQVLTPEKLGFSNYAGVGHVSVATMLRLQIPTLLPSASRVIWLDGDLVVHSPLHGLWNGSACHGSWNTIDSSGICARSTNSNEFSAVGAKNIRHPEVHEQQLLVKSFNAGVLLLDLQILRQHDFSEKINKLLKVSNLQDQQALNLYAQGIYAELDAEWNAFVLDADFERIVSPNVVHFNGPVKPWLCEFKGKEANHWRQYASSTFQCKPTRKQAGPTGGSPPPASLNGALQWIWNAKAGRDDDIFVVWSSVRDVPEAFVENARRLVQLNPNRKVYGLCAAPQCESCLGDVGVVTEPIRLPTLVLDVRMKQWFANHAIHKILGGPDFEDHFHRAVVLAALYQYGGLYVDLTARPHIAFPDGAFQGQWALAVADGSLWSLCRFPSQAQEIYKASKQFVLLYGQAMENQQKLNGNFYVKIQQQLQNVPGWSSSWGDLSGILSRDDEVEVSDWSRSFGTLSMDLRTKYLQEQNNHAVNLGDEIQGFPGMHFLPRIDYFVDRDDLAGFVGGNDAKRPTLVFVNAWYGTPSMTWPPSSNVDPVLNALHIEQDAEKLMLSPSSLEYVRNHGGVGARDEDTLQLFENHRSLTEETMDLFDSSGSLTELTGCMTLLLQPLPWERRFANTSKPIDGSHRIYIVDTPADVLRSSGIPQSTLNKATHLSHHYEGEDRFDKYVRFRRADHMLDLLRGARLVITSRLHAALPSVAMGVPTIFVKSDDLPGGYDAKHDRVDSSLMQLFHVVDLTKKNEGGSRLQGFDYSHPPKNPGSEKLQWFRTRLFHRICSKPYLADYFKMFADQQTIDLMNSVAACSS